eukprot:CAMPEP_0117556520 /NCGR_PEP_ID=MMETSP0784-20121206/51852_1 /TAXON_ID=39447 /ORGANISM="" /LENGTH=338 /DNA_ID=CAMNT_0005353799 /DNA_START=59 /DNA_END=1075 /DNA_ORIENTATION=+
MATSMVLGIQDQHSYQIFPQPSATFPVGIPSREEVERALHSSGKRCEFRVLEPLGQGEQATVYKAIWARSFATCRSSITVALKVLHSNAGKVRDREALTLLTDHPNLTKCFHTIVDPPYVIVSEYCAGGTLFDLLYNTNTVISLWQRLKILVDVSSGMAWLHAQNPIILHRDLKSSNVLLARAVNSQTEEPYAKVADFGLSREATKLSTGAMTACVGTWRWMAPEVFDVSDHQTYDERADVFSFAMVMYEVLTRQLPYAERFPNDCFDPRIGLNVVLGLRPSVDPSSGIHPQLIEIMQSSWAGDPLARPTFETIQPALQEVLSFVRSDTYEGTPPGLG